MTTTPKTSESVLSLDAEDLRLLLLWAWAGNQHLPPHRFARKHILKLVQDNIEIFTPADLRKFGFTLKEQWVAPESQ